MTDSESDTVLDKAVNNESDEENDSDSENFREQKSILGGEIKIF
jgi:hypothetical protein